MATIEKLLRDNYTEGVFHTHVSLIHPKGRYLFDRTELEIFWDEYSKNINSGNIVGIAEKPQTVLPVLVDIDLKIVCEETTFDPSEHLYTNEQLYKVIEVYQTILFSIVEDIHDKNLLCVVLEKDIYYKNIGDTRYAKNGFHLHFPWCFLSKVEQEMQLIPRVKEELKNLKLFQNLGIEDSGSVVDKASCTVPWLLYGSSKCTESKPYKVTKVLDLNCEEVDIEKAFKNYKIYDENEKPLKIGGRVKEYLPRILSIIPYGRDVKEIKKSVSLPVKEKKIKERKIYNSMENVKENLEIAKKLLPMLASSRASDRNDWLTVGWILYNIGGGTNEALELWLNFSRRCEDKYDESTCIYQWERMTVKDLSLGTLKYYASIDNPNEYNKFKSEQSEKFVNDSLEGCHNDIARILYMEYGTEFVCASITTKKWYQFRDHHWEEIENGIFLREKLSSEIVKMYAKIGKKLFDNLTNTPNKAEGDILNSRIKQVQKIINGLKTASFKTNVMKEAMEIFYDKRFKDKLDQDGFLFGFKNGIYDLKLNIFRPGRPEDFISVLSPIEYIEYDKNSEEVHNVLDYLQKVFPDSSVRNYFLDIYSDIFVGGNSQKKIFFWTGEGGDNGKSITQQIFEKMLGRLNVKFATQYFTGKKISTGSANPELARAAPPVRQIMLEEPNIDEQLNIGDLKKLSGGDSFWARDLYEGGKSTKEVFPMFIITFICNKLPKLRNSDQATWNRFRVIPFESTFIDINGKCPDTFEEQLQQKKFPMDREFSGKVPGMLSAFAWYLLDWRKNVKPMSKRSVEPEKVLQATTMYRLQNDIYRQFLEECIIEDDSSISLSEIYSHFKEWYKEGFPNNSLPVKNDVKEHFQSLWGEPVPGFKWVGYRIRTLKDDEDCEENLPCIN